MSFGTPAGPPASAQQMRRLVELIHQAGHTDFRDARGPLGLNQRQAAGRFTRTEAEEFIVLLESMDATDVPVDSPIPPISAKMSAHERQARSLPDAVLAAELQGRGWIVVEP